METINIKNVSIDVRKGKSTTIEFFQNDTNIIKFMVTDGGTTPDLESIDEILVNYERPDGEIFTRLLGAEANVITYQLSHSEMAISGPGKISLQFYKGSDRLSTFTVNVSVRKSLEATFTREEVQGGLVAQVLDRINEVKERMEDIVIEGGGVPLSSSLTSTSENTAATSKAVKSVNDTVTSLNTKVTSVETQVNNAKGTYPTLSAKLEAIQSEGGGVPLSSSLTSTSENTAATSKAVKDLNDRVSRKAENSYVDNLLTRIEALESAISNGTIPPAPTDTTPPILTITPGSTFNGTKSVTMSANEAATIYYTLNGSTPTASSSVYSAPLTISATTTLKAFARDTVGNDSAVQTVVYTLVVPEPGDTTPPSNVTNLGVTNNTTGTSLMLTWTASASSDVAGYEIHRGSTLLTTVTGTTYNATGLTAGTSYTFTVKAKDATGNIASGTSVTATATLVDTTPPANVTNLNTSNVSTSSVNLLWTASTSGDVSAYEIYNGSTLVTSITGTSYTVTGLTSGVTYTFTVKAKDATGNVASGTSVTVRTTNNAVTSVSLNRTSITLEKDSTTQLIATVLPALAENKNVTWSSSNTNIATVSSAGLISAVDEGNVIITVTTVEGSFMASCSVQVTQVITGFDYNNLVVKTAEGTLCNFDQKVYNGGLGEFDYVHPSVLYFENGWNGYKYWMGVNPYPGTSGAFENPFIFHSNDGVTWTTPAGLTQPIYPKETDVGNNSDSHIFMDYDGVTMHYLNRGAHNEVGGSGSMTEIFSTTDGVTWTPRQRIITMAQHNVDYVSPSVCKVDGKYYMFATDVTNHNVLCVLEATSPKGIWTEINRISTGTLGAMWHCEVQYINREFIVVGSTGGISGGHLMLGKFNSVMDTVITGRNNAFAVAVPLPVGVNNWSSNIYKSNLLIKSNGEIDVFIGFKGGTLDSLSGWRVWKAEAVRLPQTLSIGPEYQLFGTYGNDVSRTEMPYTQYMVDFRVDSTDFRFSAFANSTNQHANIQTKTDEKGKVVYVEQWGILGGTKEIPITYGLSIGDRVTMSMDNNDFTVYINGRAVYKDIGSGTLYDKIGTQIAKLAGAVSDIKVYVKSEHLQNTSKALEYKNNALTDYASNPDKYVVVDEFNRTSLGKSDNNFIYDIVGVPKMSGTALKPNGMDANAILIPVEGNFQILLSRGATLRYGVYLGYTNTNNYVKYGLSADAVTSRFKQLTVKNNGVTTNTELTGRGINSDKNTHIRLDFIDGVLHAYEDSVLQGSFPISNLNSYGKYIGLTSVFNADVIDYLIVKQLESTIPVTRFVTRDTKFTGSHTVRIASSNPGASIYYTLDGTTPTASSQLYTAPILLNDTATINAISIDAGGTGQVKTQTFTKGTVSEVVTDLFDRADTVAGVDGLGTATSGQTWVSKLSTSSAQILGNQATFTADSRYIIETIDDIREVEFTLAAQQKLAMYFRYIDENNYIELNVSSVGTNLFAKVGGTLIEEIIWSSAGNALNSKIKVTIENDKFSVFKNNILIQSADVGLLKTGKDFGIGGVNGSKIDDLKVKGFTTT